MYADVVEVHTSQPGHLQVTFADGTTGSVEIAATHLTGVFAPLRDPAVFAQVRVVDGFVSWPGEIDLAPDAMYAAIAKHGIWRLEWRHSVQGFVYCLKLQSYHTTAQPDARAGGRRHE